VIEIKKLVLALRTPLFAATLALGAAVGVGACAASPEGGDVEELMTDEPELEEEGLCGTCPHGQTCAVVSSAACCVGSQKPVACALQPSVDVWGTPPIPGGVRSYSASVYGNTACADSFVIGYQDAVVDGVNWFEHAEATVSPLALPSNPCDCVNTVVMLEVEDRTCLQGPGVPGSCCDGDFCAGSCDSPADCSAGYSCVGFVPGQPSCLQTEIVRRSQNAAWSSTFGCVSKVSIARDAGTTGYFLGELPQIRATAMDRRTGQELPVTVRTYAN